ncbi:MAG: hypothetical protein QOD83_259 [Solirubrobacteraceae bacterium]|jgi:hypothetical protein|nr:hypothetical protein [Solirubrobacteraceae bacterium]
MPGRIDALAGELKQLIRLAGKRPDDLIGQLPVFSSFARVREAGDLSGEAQVHFIMHTLVPEYADRLPLGPSGKAIRELLAWTDDLGEVQTLDTRYHKAAEHIMYNPADFGRRREPKLLDECARYFIQFDLIESQVAGDGNQTAADHIRGIEPELPGHAPSDVGIVKVFEYLDYHRSAADICAGTEIIILSTWIPAVELFEEALHTALTRGARVRILLVHPESRAAAMRTAGLRREEDQVRRGVRHCLGCLASVASELDEDARSRLQVRLYDSLPSIAVYSVDRQALVSVFLHDQLASDAPQIEVQGDDSFLGKAVFREVDTLWNIAHEFSDLRSWSNEIDGMLGQRGRP